MAYVTDAAGSAHTPTLLVVGYPITLYGKRAAQARAVDALVQMLRMHLQVPIRSRLELKRFYVEALLWLQQLKSFILGNASTLH
ncbi:MAG: hypothetical protein AAJB65_00710 [Candidatus Hodgkinia cicadicola]